MAKVYKYKLTKQLSFDGRILSKGEIVEAFYNIEKNGFLIFLHNGWFWLDNCGLLERQGV